MPAIEQLDDAVLARLAAGREADGTAFLAPHHIAAANRLAKLVERSRLDLNFDVYASSAHSRDGRRNRTREIDVVVLY